MFTLFLALELQFGDTESRERTRIISYNNLMEQNNSLAIKAVIRQVDKALVDAGLKRPFWEDEDEIWSTVFTVPVNEVHNICVKLTFIKDALVKAFGKSQESMSSYVWTINSKVVELRTQLGDECSEVVISVV